MRGGAVWSSAALWNGVTLLNDAAVGVYGMILSAAFCGITWTRGKKWAYGLSMAAILLAQAAVYGMTTDLQLLKLLYPLVTHMPLVLVLAILERKLLWPTISVLTAYLCCQLRRWLALLLTALMSGGAEVQTAAELALTLPLLLGLLYFVAPAVRTIAGYKPAMQVRFGLIPAVGYLFDYLTRIYTDLLAQGTPAAVEFMPFVCCVAYLAFVLRSSAENETRLRLEQTQENLHLQVTQATREIASLRESERRASTYRHDLRHHMQYLAGCIENGRTEQAQAYIREVCAEIESQKVRVFCENETVNLILSSFAGRAEESGVPLRVRAEVPHFIPVAETDLCVLLSNALENALHACQRLRQAGQPCDIELVVYEKSGKFFLQVTNTCPPSVTFEKGLPVTREPGHGIGVRSICSIAERYNGMYSFSEKDGRFVLRVSL